MATNFPGSLDTSTQQPTIASSDEMDDSGKEHDVVHTNHSGAIIALETKLGSTDSNPSAGAVLMGTGSGTSAWDATPTFTGDVTIPDGDLILGSTAVAATATEINAVADGALDWTAWTPTFTNWTKGNATVNAKYAVVGNICYYQFYYLGGSTSAYTTGGMRFSVPVTTSTDLIYQPTGIGWARPTSNSTIFSIFGMEISETIVMYSQRATLDFVYNDVLDSVTPAGWTTSSPYGSIFLQGWYRIA